MEKQDIENKLATEKYKFAYREVNYYKSELENLIEDLQKAINEKKKVYLKEHKNELTREQMKELKNRTSKKKRWIVAAAVLINLGLLIFLKYFNFIGGNLKI